MTYRSVSIDIDFSDFDSDVLIDEVESRGYTVQSGSTNPLLELSIIELVDTLYQLRRTGQDYEQVLDRLIYKSIGRIA